MDTLVGLVEHYSPSGQERGAVEWLIERMKSLGFDDASVDGVGNAVGVMGTWAEAGDFAGPYRYGARGDSGAM